MSPLRLGTRGSRLALAQSRWVAERIRDAHGVEVELVEIRTSGDLIRDVPLAPSLGQAFFTREIEGALLDGRIDLAVHSCKDLATVLPAGLRLGAVPEREDPSDVLVSRAGALAELPSGARVGTSSPRRRGFLGQARPDLTILDQRGNVPTRVKAVDEGTYDAIVLAAAGLRRLGMEDRITEVLDPALMLPAASQGALAVQVREADARVGELVAVLEDPAARAEVTAERACLRRLGAGCQAPVGARARVDGEVLDFRAAVVTPDGIVEARGVGPSGDAERIGEAAATDLLEQLRLSTLREASWAGAPASHAGRAGGAR